uniref:Uncharacterized protein n=1 Tax=Megaselia scalaris TaxID=36166 RepID=T1GLD4_MEGSC
MCLANTSLRYDLETKSTDFGYVGGFAPAVGDVNMKYANGVNIVRFLHVQIKFMSWGEHHPK